MNAETNLPEPTVHFADRLAAAVRSRGTPLVVGLDPRVDKLPQPLQSDSESANPLRTAAAYRKFCCEIIEVVAPLVPAVKPQAAFFEQMGPAGMIALHDVISFARQKNLVVIYDGKRNDIGSTAIAYALGILGRGSGWQADALTVSPYLGGDSLEPFVEIAKRTASGIFVLAKTSNPEGGMLQDLVADGKPVYRHVAEFIAGLAAKDLGDCGYGAVGAVVGATYPEQLAELREVMPQSWFLVPGFGAQGAGAEQVAPAFDSQGLGAVINSSRAIIFADSRKEYRERFAPADWQRAVEQATRDTIDQLKSAGIGSREA